MNICDFNLHFYSSDTDTGTKPFRIWCPYHISIYLEIFELLLHALGLTTKIHVYLAIYCGAWIIANIIVNARSHVVPFQVAYYDVPLLKLDIYFKVWFLTSSPIHYRIRSFYLKRCQPPTFTAIYMQYAVNTVTALISPTYPGHTNFATWSAYSASPSPRNASLPSRPR